MYHGNILTTLRTLSCRYKKEWKRIGVCTKGFSYTRKPFWITVSINDCPMKRQLFWSKMITCCNPPFMEVKLKWHVLICVDCQGSSMYTQAQRGMLNHLSIKHWHVPLIICFLVQSWVGVPRMICLNVTQYLIFMIKKIDKTQLDQIYSSFANTISRDQFKEVYKEGTGSNPHGFLNIDVVPKEPWMRFRKGFNKFLIPPDSKQGIEA